ncbi:MAG: DUF637 domain-containing protein [Sulfuricella sp.]
MRRLFALLLILILNAQGIGSAAASIPHFSFPGSAANQGTSSPAPAGSAFTPTAPALFSSAARLSLLAPVGQNYLDSLLPDSLRNSSTPFLMDAWLEQQSLRQAALRETGQATFSGAIASAAGGLASSATTQFLSSGRIDGGQLLKSGLSAGLTAGLTSAPVFGGESLNQWANVQTTAGNITGTFNPDSFGQNLLGMAGRGVVTAGVGTALYGGSFGQAFKVSLVNDLAAVGANAVGLNTKAYTPENVAGHALVGAAAASLRGQDALAGAIGGAVGSMVSPALIDATTGDDMMSRLGDPSRLQSATVTALSMLAGGAAASALGHDPVAAAQAAQNEALNNALLHKTQLDKLRQRKTSSRLKISVIFLSFTVARIPF